MLSECFLSQCHWVSCIGPQQPTVRRTWLALPHLRSTFSPIAIIATASTPETLTAMASRILLPAPIGTKARPHDQARVLSGGGIPHQALAHGLHVQRCVGFQW